MTDIEKYLLHQITNKSEGTFEDDKRISKGLC